MKLYTYTQIIGLVLLVLIALSTIMKGESTREANRILARDTAKGIAIHNYMLMVHNLDIPPEEAMYLNINANTYDVSIEDVTMFITNIEGRAK